MDEDINSSNLPPVDNTGAVGVPSGPANSNRQALFTPESAETTGDTDVRPQPSVNSSHPYLSNHPTQTFNTDTGDIILNTGGPKPKQNKRPFIIGGIILSVFVVVCGIALFVSNRQNGGSNVDVFTLIRENVATVEKVETLFFNAKRRNIPLGTILNADFYNETKDDINKFLNFQRKLSDASLDETDQTQKEQITKLLDRITTYAPGYQRTMELYESVYTAYTDNNSGYFNDLLKDKDQNIVVVARRFADYFEFRDYWQDVLASNDCSVLARSQDAVCIDAQTGYDSAMATFDNNTPAVQCLFSAYDNSIYTSSEMAYRLMQQIISDKDMQ